MIKFRKMLRLGKAPPPEGGSFSPRSPRAASAPAFPAITSPRSPRATSLPASPSLKSPLRQSSRSRSNKELEAVFEFMDSNRDGKISFEELHAVLTALGDNPNEEDLRKMVQEVDSDGDGFISLEEFLQFNGTSAASTAELEAAFHVFDIDNNGFIAPDELHKVLVGLGDKGLTMEDCGKMIRGVDVDGDGLVDFEEFKVMMMATA